jgi:tripartite-type tricarboxylate transporter receptor subunit TctC
MFRVLLVLLASALASAAAAQPAADAGWPDKPIRLIVPFPAGSSADVVGRILAQKLSVRLGQQVIAENRVGASGNIGVDALAKSAPDGYTIGIVTGSTHAVAPSLSPSLPYDPIKDFKPITMIGAAPYVLVVYPGLPAKNMAELIALAKAKPDTLNYGSAGPASLAHLASASFATLAGIRMTHVPYKSSAQSVVDMMTGRLDMQFATIAPTLPNIRAGQLRALVTTGKQRVSALPDVPTVAESGLPGYEVSLWLAFMGPAAMPDSIATRLHAEITTILSAPETKETLQSHGYEPEPGPPGAVVERIRTEIAKWRDVVAKAGIRAE